MPDMERAEDIFLEGETSCILAKFANLLPPGDDPCAASVEEDGEVVWGV